MSARILVIDDSLTVRMDLIDALEGAGFEAVGCDSAAAARTALNGGSFALVLLDVVLPDADGVELLKELRGGAATARIPVVLLSSETEVRDRIRGMTTGADEYIGKPYDRSYLVARVRQLIRAREGAGGKAATTVLLIDDSPTYLQQMKAALEEAGYAVLTAATGEEGLRLAVDRRPSAMIVDGILPGIDGATVVRRVRSDAALRGTPCVLLTASEERGDELKALDAGFDAYVRKDADSAVLLAKLAAVLRSAAGTRAPEPSASLLGPKRILAIDDSLTYLDAVAEQLRQSGYGVVLARSGEEALEVLEVQVPDCILLDLGMPGLSGQETCRRIKASPLWRDIPLLMLTARDDHGSMIEGINAGADDYIAKSSDFEVLRARLHAQLRRKQFEDENRQFREQLVRKELEAAEARAAHALAEARAVLLGDLKTKNAQLAQSNSELQAFSYSVSHDLRAPLRTIDGFTRAVLEDCASVLDLQSREHLERVRTAARRMAELIEDLLKLARLGRDLRREPLDLSELALGVASDLQRDDPARRVRFSIQQGLSAVGDPRLLRVLFENLLGNAWKFTSKRAQALIEVGVLPGDVEPTYFVRDDGAGFDETYAHNLFVPFQRLHPESEFPGSGIGLATAHRVIDRHGGRIWATGKPGAGATFCWTLPTSIDGGHT